EAAEAPADPGGPAPADIQAFLDQRFGKRKGFFNTPGEDEAKKDGEAENAAESRTELTAGAALVQLVLGGKLDPSQGYKYGYALCSLCEYLGNVLAHDAWSSIRATGIDTVDAVLHKAGVGPGTFSVHRFLVERGAPVAMPRPEDFPYIGYLKRGEIR